MHVSDSEEYCASYAVVTDEGLDELHTEFQVWAGDFAEPGPYAVMSIAERLHEDGKTVTPDAVRHVLVEEDPFSGLDNHAEPEAWWSSFIGAAGGGDSIDFHAPRVRIASMLRPISDSAGSIQHVCTRADRPKDALEKVEGLTQDLLEAQAKQDSSVMGGEDIAEGVIDLVCGDEPANLKLPTGWPSYDDTFGGLVQNRINVFAGRTDHGKSVVADQIALNVARRGKKVIKFDLENDESAVQMRLASNLSGVPIEQIADHAEHKKKLGDDKLSSVFDAADKLQSIPLRVDTTPGATSTYIRSRVLTEQAQDDEDVALVIVDYLTQMGDPGDGAMEQVMNAVTGLHSIAQELGVTVLAISQINRQPLSEDDPQPKLHHMSWSDDVAQKPAQVTTILHDLAHWDQTSRASGAKPDPEKFSIFVRKNKGTKGPLQLRFQKDCLRIVDEQDRQPYEDGAPF